MFKSEFATFKNNILTADTTERLQRLERSLDTLFNNGIFTPEQFSELDLMILDEMLDLEMLGSEIPEF